MASSYVQKVIRSVKKNNPHQPEFIQALEEVPLLELLFLKHPCYQQNGISERSSKPGTPDHNLGVVWTTTRAACVQVNRVLPLSSVQLPPRLP